MLYDSPETADHRSPDRILMEMEEHDDADAPIVVEGMEIPPDALAIFCRILLPDGKPTTPSYWAAASRRLAALAHGLQVNPVRQYSLKQIGEALGCSRSLMSLLACELRDFGGLDCRAGRLASSREHYSESARAVWGRRGRAQAAAVAAAKADEQET